jgi:hypothetical protein
MLRRRPDDPRRGDGQLNSLNQSSGSKKLSRVAYALVLNAVSWFVIPDYLLSDISKTTTSLPLSYDLVIVFGASIIALEVLAALTMGSALAAIFNSGASLTVAVYIYIATDGGYLSLTSNGVTVDLSFPLLVALLILPSLFNVARLGVSYLLDQSEGSRPIPDEVRG